MKPNPVRTFFTLVAAFVIAGIVVAVLAAKATDQTAECEEKGGVMVRSTCSDRTVVIPL